MVERFLQGDILKIENVKHPVVVVSKDFFNTSGEALVCPIITGKSNSPLHIFFSNTELEGEVYCEQIRLFDLNVRGYKKIGEIRLGELMVLCDTIQGIIDCI